MKFAYADPPYLGCGRLYAEHHPDALDWDDPERHRRLIAQLEAEYPDGWAMSLSAPSLRTILPMCPKDCRWGPWVKPFASFKPNVNPAFAFEPVIWRGGRPFTRADDTVRDWVAANITLKRGLTGAKPREVCRWVFSLLNAKPGDELEDLFPGTGAVSAAWREWAGEHQPAELFGHYRRNTDRRMKMAKRTVNTKFFEFDQNNSGGSFDKDDKQGIGPRVWIEALNADDANERATRIGIYFNGCDSGMDCSCCGDRWSPAWRDESGKDAPDVSSEYAFSWTDTIYVHKFDGTIERLKKAAA